MNVARCISNIAYTTLIGTHCPRATQCGYIKILSIYGKVDLHRLILFFVPASS